VSDGRGVVDDGEAVSRGNLKREYMERAAKLNRTCLTSKPLQTIFISYSCFRILCYRERRCVYEVPLVL
jgi:hypothetical protein